MTRVVLNKLGIKECLWDTHLYRACLWSEAQKTQDHSNIFFFKRLIRQKTLGTELWFDVGANMGSRTSLFLRLGPKVVAVEPDPENIKILHRRFRFRKKAVVIPAAVSKENGLIHLYQAGAYSTVSQKNQTLLTRPEGFMGGQLQDDQRAIPVPCLTLDSLIQSHGIPDFIKIDVEGWESMVLQGLSHAIKLISFEANLPDFLEETIDCLNQLTGLGDYEFNYVNEDPPNQFSLPSFVCGESLVENIRSTNPLYCEIYAHQKG